MVITHRQGETYQTGLPNRFNGKPYKQAAPMPLAHVAHSQQQHRLRPVSFSFASHQKQMVRFASQQAWFSKYQINPTQVSVNASPGITITLAEKRQLIVQALQTYEHAVKKRLLNERLLQQQPQTAHVSGRCFSSTVVLNNGTSALAVNSEFTRDDVLCGERSGITSA